MRHQFPGPALDCQQVLERLPLFVGEDLERDVHAAVVQHLILCAACRGEEALARVARERFRGVLDESLRSCTRVGLWPELRARMIDEGLLAGARPAEAAARAPQFVLDPAVLDPSPVPAARVRTPSARRGLRLLVPLAAAAAVVLTVFASDPFQRPGAGLPGGPGVGEPIATSSAAPSVPVANVSGTGGLRRLEAEERSLTQDAEPLQRDGLAGRRPTRLSGTTLVSYR